MTEEDGEDSIDDEEEGGEWINEDNLAKHLTHGFAVPAAPTEREEGVEVKEGATVKREEEKKEDVEEEEEDFPAFDESKLPPMEEIEQKEKASNGATESTAATSEPATQMISTTVE